MADTLKYGWVRGGHEGNEAYLVNDEYFHRLGGAFVCASAGSGHMKLCSAVTEALVGWAEVPRAAVPGTVDFWKSSSTAGNDKVFVITDRTAIFKVPVAEAKASLSASLVGRYCNATWSGSGSTYKQLVDASATAVVNSQMFFCVGVDTDSKTGRCAYVRISDLHLNG